MDTTIKIERKASPPHPPAGEFLCGFAETDITPHPGFPLAGFSTVGEIGHGVRGHLFARALYLRDTTGQDVAIIVVDLMSATRVLLELVAQHTRDRCGLGVDRLFLHGTHTHTGPAWFYGSSLYDTFVAKSAGFDRALVDWMARRIADTVVAAHASARPGGIVIDHETRLWGVSRNRSVPAFLKNADSGSWTTTGPGAGAPALSEDEQFVDPRMTVIAARHDRGLGVFAFFGCHPTTLGGDAAFYSSDWPGEAVRLARTAIHAQLNQDAVVAVGIRATGDVNGYRYDLTPFEPPGHGLETRVAKPVAAAIASTAIRTRLNTKSEPITVWFAEPRVDGAAAKAVDTQLAERWYFGSPTAGGSEESRSVFFKVGLAHEGQTGGWFDEDDPQYPKARAVGPIHNILRALLDLDAPAHLPLTAVRIGRTIFAGLPGEPTITTAFNIERALESSDFDTVVVLPCTGDYSGYFATKPEYLVQHYEGSSTLWGRNSAPFLEAQVKTLVSNPPTPAQAGTIEFTTRGDERRFAPTDRIPAGTDPRPKLDKSGARIAVHWLMPEKACVVFANGWWVRVEAHVSGQWTPVIHGGRPLDDVNYPILIERIPDGFFDFDRTELWRLTFDLPGGLPAGQYRVVVAPRDRFAGFAMEFEEGKGPYSGYSAKVSSEKP